MIAWLALTGAILGEVTGTSALRAAADGKIRWYALVAVGYVFSFACFITCLAEGMPLGVAYGIWTAVGIALTAMVSHTVFHERMTAPMAIGMALIMVGVLVIESSGGSHSL